jgi:pimeloyl-ACP methyl ester carboxylesterase
MVPYMNVSDQDDRFLGSTIKPGPFRDLYYDYESNSLFKAVQKAKKTRDLMGKEHVYDAALRAAGVDSTLVVLEGAGHKPSLDCGSAAGNALLEFLDRTLAPNAAEPRSVIIPAAR